MLYQMPSTQAPRVHADGQQSNAVATRRAALASGVGLLASTMMPTRAQAELVTNDAREAALAKERAKQEASDKADAEEGKSNGVIALAVGGTLLSVPLFLPNLQRLGTKIASGG